MARGIEPVDGPLPPEEEAVRRLLADARATDPVPPEVAARLDAALAGVAAERFGPPIYGADGADGTGGNTPDRPDRLAEQRRRRQRRRRALVAAAAVVAVAGLGGVLVGGDGTDMLTSGGSAESASAGDGAESGGSADREGPEAAADGTLRGPRSLADLDGADAVSLDGVLRGGDRLPAQVERLLRAREVTPTGAPGGGVVPQEERRFLTACRPAAGEVGPADEVLTVAYDERLAQLVVRDPDAERSVVDLFVCGEPGVVRSVLVDLP